MLAQEMMTADPVCATPADSVQTVARLMKEHHCGALPVIRGDHDRFLLGIVTDRDLALRIIAPGKPPDTPVGEVMSAGVSCCLPDARVEHVEEIMIQRQVRRVPVVDPTGACIGIIALGDIARAAAAGETIPDSAVAHVLESVSAPTDVARSDADVGTNPERLRSALPQPERWPEQSRPPRQARI
jgi:CBS domain-containing protein